MRSADIHTGEEYAVNARRNDWSSTRPETLRGRVAGRTGRRHLVNILEQDVKRSDGRSGTTTLKPFTTLLAPVNILRPWAEEEANRAEAKRQQEESLARLRAEMKAEEEALRARIDTVRNVLEDVPLDRYMREQGMDSFYDQVIDQCVVGHSSSLTISPDTLLAIIEATS